MTNRWRALTKVAAAVFGKPMGQGRSERWAKAPMLSLGSHPHTGGSCVLFTFSSTGKCISSHIKKPRDRQQCNLRTLVPYSWNSLVFFSFYSVYSICIPCWGHPQVCNMMVQGIMSTHGGREEERWASSCDSSLEGRQPFPEASRQYYNSCSIAIIGSHDPFSTHDDYGEWGPHHLA